MALVAVRSSFQKTTLIVALAALCFASFGYWLISQIDQRNQDAEQMAIALRNHVEGDMMHDAIRSAVYKAEIARANSDADKTGEARKELERYSIWFERKVFENKKLDLPPKVEGVLAKTRPPIADYIEKAKQAQAAINGNAPNHVSKLAEFERGFEQLEATQLQASNAIEAEIVALRELAVATNRIAYLGFSFMTLVILGAIGWAYRSTVKRLIEPLEKQTEILFALSRGRDDIEIETHSESVEMERLTEGITRFRDNMEAMRASSDAMAEAELRSTTAARNAAAARAETAEEKREALLDLATSMEQRILAAVERVAASAAELRTVSSTVAETARATVGEAGNTRDTGQQIAGNIDQVATASTQLSSNANMIGDLVKKTLERLGQAEARGSDADRFSQELMAVSNNIGDITQAIAQIAKQTNMLALNATIEASRAGEAGQGFAVVAQEVKALAAQTSGATQNIARQIESLRKISSEVSESVDAVASSIGDLREASNIVSSSTDEQLAATHEIERNAYAVASGTRELAEAAGRVNALTERGNASASDLQKTADELGTLSAQLRTDLVALIQEVRAA